MRRGSQAVLGRLTTGLALFGLVATTGGCSATIGDLGPADESVDPGGGATPPPGVIGGGACDDTAPATQRLFLMDMQSYINSITDLLGADAVTDLQRMQAQRTDLFTNGVPTLSDATERETPAEYASKTLTGAKLNTFTGCAGAAQSDDCAKKALSAFMEKAYRRPVDAAEVDSLMTTAYKTGHATSFERGIQLGVEAVLQAGSTLYLKEIGAPSTPGRALLDPFEVASQLSFFLLDSIPDADLYQAAVSGRLKDPAEVESQVTRLLANPKAQSKLTDLLLRQYHLDDVLTATAVDGSLQDVYTAALRSSFYEESSRLIDDVLWKTPRSYQELFTSNKTFANDELAQKVYGIPFTGKTGEFVPVTLPAERATGLLTRGSFLAGKAKANTGSVVKRGKSIRINFLCLSSPPPPPLGNPAVKAKLETQQSSPKSESELAAERAADSVCRVCHSTFDPLGLALNQFDRVGRFVSTEQASASLSKVDPLWEGVDVNGPGDLGKKVSEHPSLASCVASSVVRYATREPNLTSDCAIQKAGKQFSDSGLHFDSLVKAVATSDRFLERSQGGAQ